MAVTARANASSENHRRDITRAEDLSEPFEDLVCHAALAVLAPVGSWRRAEPLHEVWACGVGVAQPLIKSLRRSQQVATVGDLARQRENLYALARPSASNQEDRVIEKTIDFLRILDELIDEAASAVIETSKKQLLTYADSAPLSHGNLKRSSRAAKPTSAPENDQAFVSLGKSRRRQLEFIERARLKATSESSEKALANERWKRTSGAREARQGEQGMAYRVRPRLSPLRSFGAK